MAGVRFAASTGPILTVIATTKTLVQLVAATNVRIRVERIIVSGQGIAGADAPVQIEVVLQTTAGTMSALTLKKLNGVDTETLQSTAQHTATVEPTTTDVKAQVLLHPQTTYTFVFPPDRPLYIVGGARLGVRAVTPGVGNSFSVHAECEE